ncbi:plasma membrane calcium [Dipsacomyces acuminosporus]|nr:plasma membrane calcium [Dipsacomyces acuminosporus]
MTATDNSGGGHALQPPPPPQAQSSAVIAEGEPLATPSSVTNSDSESDNHSIQIYNGDSQPYALPDGEPITPEQLASVVADKDVAGLRKLGGTDGLLRILNISLETGIVPAQHNVNDTAGEPTKLETVKSKNAELAKELAAEQEDADVSWLAEFESDRKLYSDRIDRFGANILPPAKSRTFLNLVWEALKDKMLILLIVAAVVSLGIGIYQDVRPTDDPEEAENVHWVEGFAIIVAITVVTLVASINDYQKEKQFRKLNAKKNDRRVRVTRGGQERLVSTNCIVVGDILHIEPGDILCADGIVVSSSNLKCDESSVTGESDAMKKRRLEEAERANADRKKDRQRRRTELRNKRREQRAQKNIDVGNDMSGVDADDSTDGEEDLAKKTVTVVDEKSPTIEVQQEAKVATESQLQQQQQPKASGAKGFDPFLISGSRVLEGVGRCVIVAVGENSFYGRTLMSLRIESEPTPLQAKLNGLAELIAKLGGAAGLLMFLVLIIKYFVEFGRHQVSREATKVVDSIVRIIISAVTVVVVAVPEGLPLAVTLALAVATTRMLKDNCLVRVLASCETMGNATTICSDKTGTLTQNRMTVVAGCIGDQYQFSSYPPGMSEMQRRQAKQPPADGLVTDMTGRAVPPEKAIVPTFLETETRRQRRLRNRRHRQQQRRRMGSSLYSSSSALTPTSDISPSISGVSDLSDFSEDDDMIVPTAELGEEAPQSIINLCHDAIAVNSTAFIAAEDPNISSTADDNDEGVTEGLLPNSSGGSKKKPSLWRRLFGTKKPQADAEESLGVGASAAKSSADKFTGSKTETALLSWSEVLGAPEYTQLREKDVDQYVQVWPFSSERKCMSTLVKVRRREDGKQIWRLYVKGAPEVVIQNCKWIVDIDGAFQNQDREEIINGSRNGDASVSNFGDIEDDDAVAVGAAGGGVPQISFEQDSDTESGSSQLAMRQAGESSGLLPVFRVDAATSDIAEVTSDSTNNNGESSSPASNSLEPYLLSAHYSGSRHVSSDTTDVGEDASSVPSFPSDFAHNPAVPVLPLDDETLRDLRRTVSQYASRALRTIGMAYRDFSSFDEACLAQMETDTEWREASGLVCLGVFAIEDPLREGVTDAVRRCQNAGIVVRMVTGDNILTARAIATQCGIYTPGMGGVVLEGPKFRKMTPDQMDAVIPRLQVLARSSPEDKRMLVEWLRTHGEVVSVTGDGTNDGPALKAANIGFSMGIAGTEVAKEASSIVVMDDNFKSIVRACMWGRTVNDAVKKFLQFQITVNVTAVLIAFVSAVVDKEQKSVLTAVQLLWINLIMDTFAALALATDPPSEDILDRYPEKQGSPLITFTMWKSIIGQSIFQVVVCFLTLYAADNIFNLHTVQSADDMKVLRTLVFNTFAWMQIFNEFNCRVLHNEKNCFKGITKNWFFITIVLISVVGQVVIVQWGGVAFQTTALGGKYWAFSLVAGALSLPIGLVLRLIPDQLIWWMLPFVPQDIYKQPQSLEWKPPAQSVQSKLAGDASEKNNEDDGFATSNGGNSRVRRRASSADGDLPFPLSSDGNSGVKSSVFKLGADLTRRVRKSPSAAKNVRQQQQQPSAAAAAAPGHVEDSKSRNRRSGSHSDGQPKNFMAGAMVPSMVASSIGIGMSTSAMPPKEMSISDIVDKEIERAAAQTANAPAPADDSTKNQAETK